MKGNFSRGKKYLYTYIYIYIRVSEKDTWVQGVKYAHVRV